MSDSGRLQKSAKNMVSGIFYRIFTTLTAFIVRTVFIKCLSNDYLSVSGLYSSILSMLSLAELGFSTAMIFSMYAPLAQKDYNKLSQIMRMYKDVYRVIGTVILIIGLSLVPFLDILIRNKPDISGLTFYYLLYLGDSVLSYWFFAYRNAIFQADQRASIVSTYNSAFNLVKSILQIVVLLRFHNFTLYLLTQLGCTILQNIALAIKAQKDYPVFRQEKKSELATHEKQRIINDVKALMIQKVSFKVLNSSDSLIISAFVGINWVGLLSNFVMIEEAVVAVLSQVVGAISASIGNYFAKEDRESSYQLFQRVEFMNYWFYGFSSVALITLLNPFVELWLGEEYILSDAIVVALITRFFVEGYMNIMSMFRSTMGLFTQGKYLPLVVATLNIVLSIGLSYPLGVAGVLLATPLARCCINVWYMPLVIHRDGFHKPVGPFYFSCFFRVMLLTAVTCAMVGISKVICFGGVTVGGFIAMTFLTAIIPNAVFLVVFFRTDEFQYFLQLGKRFVVRRR